MHYIERHLQQQIIKLEKWTTENGFTISKSKTVAMHFIPPYIKQGTQDWKPDPVLKLAGHNIEVVKETKFLGLIWDSKLNFRAHITYLRQKCMKAMNILRVLAHTDWGADQTTLLQLYRALIRSKLDYGCIVYGSASFTDLAKLDTIQNQALRLCLGAFRSSPKASLAVQANEPPLKYRREKLTLQYGLKLKANPKIPSHKSVFPTSYRYGQCTVHANYNDEPFRVRLQNLLDEAKIKVDDIAISEDLYEPPVWDMTPVECLTHLAQHEKEHTLPQTYQIEYNITKSKYSDHHPIFTDGSKCDDKVAYACITKDSTRAKRLPDGASIFTAEASAFISALDYANFSKEKKFIIFTDSLSLIQSIENENVKNPLVVTIFKKIKSIQDQGKELVFCWVPGHCGIDGNERADRAAKEALNKTITPVKLPFTDRTPLIRSHLLKKWQTEWDKEKDKLNKLYEIQPKIGPPFLVNSCRKDQVVINRIRIGHTRLSQSYLMEGVPWSECCFCDSGDNLSVKHVLIDCEHFADIRSDYFNASNMKELFDKVKVENIIGFLRETALYRLI